MNQVTTGNKEICLLRSHISSKLTWMGMENLQKALFFAVLPSFKKSCTQVRWRVFFLLAISPNLTSVFGNTQQEMLTILALVDFRRLKKRLTLCNLASL